MKLGIVLLYRTLHICVKHPSFQCEYNYNIQYNFNVSLFRDLREGELSKILPEAYMGKCESVFTNHDNWKMKKIYYQNAYRHFCNDYN